MAMLVGHWSLRGFGSWAVEERVTGNFLGRVGLHFPDGWPDREVNWAFARQYWGKGFAFEAAQATLAHAFNSLHWEAELLEWEHVCLVAVGTTSQHNQTAISAESHSVEH